jgi:hypothetical protein
LDFRVFNAFNIQIQLILMMLSFAFILGSSAG